MFIIGFPKAAEGWKRLNHLIQSNVRQEGVVVKIGKKYSTLLLATLMTLCLDFVMTLTMTAIATGLDSSFPFRFATGFAIGFVVGLPTSLIVIRFARRLVDRLTAE